jgi:hypothetical protein
MSLEACRGAVQELLVGKSACSFKTEAEWKRAEDTVKRWFASVKVAESDDTFAAAFTDSRMTMRAILDGRQTGYYTEQVPIRGQQAAGGVRWIKTMQGVPGIKERMTPDNFYGVGKLDRAKYEKGLFDQSAVLLNPKLNLAIGGVEKTAAPPAPVVVPAHGAPPPPPPPMAKQTNQIYRTTGNTTYIFMPVVREEDLLVFHTLNMLAKSTKTQGLAEFVMYMKSRLTRIKLVFEGDAGAKFLDFAPAGDALPKFRYGFGNLLPGDASLEEIQMRRLKATEYKQALRGMKRNEIIIAYRQHGMLARQPSTFPVYAKGVFAQNARDPNDPIHKGYLVVGEDMTPTGQILTLKGEMKPGTAASLGGSTNLFPKV